MSRRRPNLWVNGLPTELAIKVFTQGDCWTLAVEIARISPLEPYLIDDGAHWIAGDGKLFLDIEGVHTRQQLLHRWEARSIRLIDDQFRDYAEVDVMDPRVWTFSDVIDRRRVVDAARRVLAAHAGRMGLIPA